MLEQVYKDHAKWINTTKKFGCDEEEAKDIVQDMYLIIGNMLLKGRDISYNGEVNYFYIYKTLKTTFLQHQIKKNRRTSLEESEINIESQEDIDYDFYNEIVEEELSKLHWYHRKVYEKIQSGQSISELSRKTNIDYHSLYNTYIKIKEHLKKQIL